MQSKFLMVSKCNTDYRMRQYYTANTEHGNEKCKDQDQIGYLGSRSPMGETALAGEGEGVRSTFDQIIIEQECKIVDSKN